MMTIPLPLNEQNRLSALQSYEIIDSDAEAEYDAITNLASQICGTSVSLITLLDENRQWFKSAVGTDVKETPREYAFCSHAIMEPGKSMMVHDLRKDKRFSENPLVTGEPHVVFYASVPLKDREGYAVGTLCVLDVVEKTLNDFQLGALQVLASQVVTLLDLRRRVKRHERFQRLLEERNNDLQQSVNLFAQAETEFLDLQDFLKEKIPAELKPDVLSRFDHIHSTFSKALQSIE